MHLSKTLILSLALPMAFGAWQANEQEMLSTANASISSLEALEDMESTESAEAESSFEQSLAGKHGHRPHHHHPHGHRPHGHRPHSHRPHSHRPHSHRPHSHTPVPTKFPTQQPTPEPTDAPTPEPTSQPTDHPTYEAYNPPQAGSDLPPSDSRELMINWIHGSVSHNGKAKAWIEIVDGEGYTIGNAHVVGQFLGDFRNQHPVKVYTNPNGRKNLFKLFDVSGPGDYKMCVMKLEKDGYTWNKPGDNSECIEFDHNNDGQITISESLVN